MFRTYIILLVSIILTGSGLIQLYASDFSTNVFPWLSENKLTTYSKEGDFRPRDPITRGEAAKFVVQFAKLIGIDKTSTDCGFSDTASYDSSLRPFTVESCEYGLFRGSNGKFLPNNSITEAQALAVVIRSAYGMQDEAMKPWYSEYFSIAQDLGMIKTETLANIEKTPITREKLATWLYLISDENNQALASGQGMNVYETEVDGPSDCSSYETYDSARKVCSYECKTELECKTTQEAVDTELAGWTDSLEGSGRDAPTQAGESTSANSKVLYSVTPGEKITKKSGTDTPEYRDLWKEVADLSPDTLSDTYIEEFEIYEDASSDVIAYVSDDDGNGKWKMSINLPTHKLSDKKEQKTTLIHELSHIITLNKNEFMTPSGACQTYQTDEGCTKSTAYLNTFVKKFWGTAKTATYDESKFVTEYATTSPEEDIAESFAFFVLGTDFSDTNIRNQKLNFFNTYPELVKIRTDMRSVLASDIIRARKLK